MEVILRDKILDKAKEIICNDRQSQYGEPEDSFGMIADLWSSYLNVDINPIDVALMMALLKIARHKGSVPKIDNFLDGTGYFAIAGELFTKEPFKEEQYTLFD